MRYFVQLSYFGKNFHGWQVQPNACSVQETLNKAFSTVLGSEIYLVGAGRTDTGVHAREMWAHFDCEKPVPEQFAAKLNRFLGADILIRKFTPVAATAHARFDAISREYEYHIICGKDPFTRDLSWQLYSPLDLEKMQEATRYLFEFEDFSSFSRSRTQTKTNICRIVKAHWQREGDHLIFVIKADRFLRNMVRAIVGTLVEVGRGKRGVEEFRDIIRKKDRKAAGESAPAQGLFLTRVEYPKEIFNGQ